MKYPENISGKIAYQGDFPCVVPNRDIAVKGIYPKTESIQQTLKSKLHVYVTALKIMNYN